MTKSRPKPIRRRFRFSLRTLLIVVVLLCLPLAWSVRKAQRQRRAVEAIRKAGGLVWYDYEKDEDEPPVPTWLMELVGDDYFADVAGVGFIQCERLDDDVLEDVKGLTELERLIFHSSLITDGDIKELQEALPNCEILDVFTPTTPKTNLDHN